MAWTSLFKISSTDLTKYELTDEHKVNREDIYEEWTDGNWITHREIARTRISGTVKLSFSRETDYANFKTLLTSARNANGYYPITVWVSNTNSTESINAFLDVIADTAFDVTVPIKHHSVTVSIIQR